MNPRIVFNMAIVLMVASVLSVSGCGGPTNVADVTGTITLGNQPLAYATVTFVPADSSGSLARAITDAEGRYQLVYNSNTNGAAPGDYTVSISTFNSGFPDAEPPKPKVLETVPVKYNLQTELKATVTTGKNTLDFSLDSDGKIIQPDSKEAERALLLHSN